MMKKQYPAPILVTGSHRSGTTWVGRMLCLSDQLGYVGEPLQPRSNRGGPGWSDRQFPYVYQYIGPENATAFLPTVRRVLELRYPFFDQMATIRQPRHVARLFRLGLTTTSYRLRGLQPLIKDPFALFASEWLAEHFGVRVIVMIRHPAAFVGSLKYRGWRFDFRNWRDQPLLLERYLAPFAGQIREYCERERDIIDQAILLWNGIYSAVHALRQRHPDWVFMRYADLASNPVGQFQRLYEGFGLHWTESVAKTIEHFSGPENPAEVDASEVGASPRNAKAAQSTWRTRLTAAEIARVKAGVADVSPWFYDEAEWELSPGA